MKVKKITIDVTALQMGLNHNAVERLLDDLTPKELRLIAMKVHGALYRRLDGDFPGGRRDADLFPHLDTLGYPRW